MPAIYSEMQLSPLALSQLKEDVLSDLPVDSTTQEEEIRGRH